MNIETMQGTALTVDRQIELVEEPLIEVKEDGLVCKTYAFEVHAEEKKAEPIGMVMSGPSRILWRDEFTRKPTGTYSPINKILGLVGTGEVYSKSVRTDLPLSGLRTAIAERRAARIVKARLNLR